MTLQATFSNPGMRIGLGITGGLLALIAVSVIIRPQMLAMGMAMAHNLIVGFGL